MAPRYAMLPFLIEHEDVGMTIETTISVGDVPVVVYRPGTRHQDMAQEIAVRVIAAALRPLLIAAIRESGGTLPSDYEE